jgi:CheY-like chemotaxis protein
VSSVALPHVLIVEDNRDSGASLAIILQMHGFDAQLVNSGAKAIQALSQRVPAALVSDLAMPGMDGYELARRIRRMPLERQPVLIALTGHGTEDDMRRGQEAGFDHHLIKPADPDALVNLLRSVAAQR